MQLPGLDPFPAELADALQAALRAEGPDHRPRTHHLGPDGAPSFTNRLIFETSPYLLQHAHNPVDWRPWGEEAFEVARALNRPVLLSVGYSTCHWCHVMERESFEDLEIAAFLNQRFVAIKVDREERPDVDEVYMAAVQMMTGHGGWPMTVVMAPDRRPFFGGTYFPARDGDRGARVGFLTLLRRLAEVYETKPAEVQASGARLQEALERHAVPAAAAEAAGPGAVREAARYLLRRFDREHGGFGHAPKFPRPSAFELLLRYHRRTQDEAARHAVLLSLDRMRRGGLYDQIGGGFHRYSTDDAWLVPHFEKMLYDNAQLAALYLDAYQAAGEPWLAETARETLDYVRREMTSPEGGFYSATDADSEGEEGRFFVWTPEALEAALGPEDAAFAAEAFGVRAGGNFEGRSVLHQPAPRRELAQRLGLEPEVLDRRLRAVAARLYEARARRAPPLLDDKILTGWNGQMIGAFARGGFVLDEPRYVEAAARAAGFVLSALDAGPHLSRAYRGGRARHRGVLEDHAFLADGLLDLFEASAEPRWLEAAQGLVERLLTDFLDPERGGFFGVARDAETILVREKPSQDGAQPSGSSVAALVLLRLFAFTQLERYRREAARTLEALGFPLQDDPASVPKLVGALEHHLDRPKEVVLVLGAEDDGAMEDVLRSVYLPNRAIVRGTAPALASLAALVPWAAGKIAADGQTTAYVCTEGLCEAPTRDPEIFRRQLLVAAPL